MYPTTDDIHLNPQLPQAAEFWIPNREEINKYGGLGYFDNVWPLLDISADQASKVVAYDHLVSTLLDTLATDDLEFEILASAAETGSADDMDQVTPRQLAALDDYLPKAESLEGLEVGVAGLVYALAASGMYPAASCRGHADSGWSSVPVVFFATDRPHAEALQPLVAETGCGFVIDSPRPELLAITSASIRGTLDLGCAVLHTASEF